MNYKRPLGGNTQADPNIHAELQGTPRNQNNHMSRVQRSCVCAVLSHFSHVQLFAMLWTVARQAPLSVELSR